jgi:hypothetical protein
MNRQQRNHILRMMVIIASLSLGTVTGHATLIVNGGFENVTGTVADNWTQFGNAYAESRSAQTGANGLTLYGNWGTIDPNYSGAYQTFHATAGEEFFASVYAKTSSGDKIGLNNSAYLKVEFFDASMGGLGWVDATNPVTNTTPADIWFLQTVNATAPAGAAFVRETLIFEQVGGAGGSAFFDNATLDAVPEPSTVLLFAVGGIALYSGHRRSSKRRKAANEGNPTSV